MFRAALIAVLSLAACSSVMKGGECTPAENPNRCEGKELITCSTMRHAANKIVRRGCDLEGMICHSPSAGSAECVASAEPCTEGADPICNADGTADLCDISMDGKSYLTRVGSAAAPDKCKSPQ
jgi:hypothetical protein